MGKIHGCTALFVSAGHTFVGDIPFFIGECMTQSIRWPFCCLVLVLVIDAQAQFGASNVLSSWPNGPELHPVDIDGDGDVDLTGSFGQEWKWFENNGDGSFASPVVLLDCDTYSPQGCTFSDVNGDLLPDLLWWQEHQVFAAMNQGAGSFTAPHVVATTGGMAIGAMAIADLTGDALPDIALTWGDDAIARVVWYRNVDGIFEPPVVVPFPIASPAPSTLLLGDINMNEGADIMLFHADGMVTAVYNISANGSIWVADTLCYATTPPFSRPQLIDVDGDGDLDLAEAGTSGIQWAENRISIMPPFEPFTVHQLEPFMTAGKGRFGHIGCEGVSLVFVPSNPQLPVQWRSFLPAINGFAPAQALNSIPRGQNLRMADLNADGREDLFMAHNWGLRWYAAEAVATTTPVELPDLDIFCRTGPAIELPAATPLNGQWSGTWVGDGLFHRANAPAGNVSLAYTFYEENNCPVGGLTSISLINGPEVTPVLGPVLCSGDGPFQMTSEPQNTQWTGLSTGNVLNLANYSGGLITSSYEDVSGIACATFIGPFQVWNTVSRAIQPAGPFCVTDEPQEIVPVVQLPNNNWGGDISGTSPTGAWFDPGQGAGTYSVILQRNAMHPQQCGGADTLTIVVSDAIPEVTALPFPEHCSSQPVQLGGASPEGGVWSGTGVMGDMIDPAITGPGTHPVTYTYTAPEGCSNTVLMDVPLVGSATVTWDAHDLQFCATDGLVQFLAQPAAGIWSAPLGTDGALDPSTLAVGDHAVIYTWTDPAGCAVTNTPIVVSLLPATEVIILEVSTLCLDGGGVLLFGSHSGIWSGSVSGEGNHVLFDPTTLGIGTWPVTLTATGPGACEGSATIDVVVSPCLGVEDTGTSSSLRVMPNPFTGEALLFVPGDAPIAVEVLDASGRLVRTFTSAASGPHQLDLEGAPNGTYMLRVHSGGSIRHMRVVKAG